MQSSSDSSALLLRTTRQGLVVVAAGIVYVCVYYIPCSFPLCLTSSVLCFIFFLHLTAKHFEALFRLCHLSVGYFINEDKFLGLIQMDPLGSPEGSCFPPKACHIDPAW